MNRVLKVIFKFERRHKLQQRSIDFQEWLYWFAIGWFGSAGRVAASGVSRTRTGLGRTFTRLGGSEESARCSKCKSCLKNSCVGRGFRQCWTAMANTACGKKIDELVKNSPMCQRMLERMNNLAADITGSPRSPRGHSIVGSGKRTAG